MKETRNLQIGLTYSSHNRLQKKAYPFLLIKGKWLKMAGFEPLQKVSISVFYKTLIIKTK